MLVSSRRGIVYPNTDRSDSADVPRDIAALVAALEIDVTYGAGTLLARPTSSPGTPGVEGRIYEATDQTPKRFYWDNGIGWDDMNGVAAGAIRGSDGADVQREILQGSIRRIDLSAQLKPSGAAVAGDEALRALGTTAATAAAGNDARLTDTRLPTVGHDPASYGTAFPTTGLFNGYRFSLFYTGGQGDFIYRADLDGTYPWHAVAGAPLVVRRQGGGGTSSATIQRAGIYRGIFAGGSSVSSLGDAGISSSFAGSGQGTGNQAAGGSADEFTAGAGSTFSVTISGTNSPSGNVGALVFPVRLI